MSPSCAIRGSVAATHRTLSSRPISSRIRNMLVTRKEIRQPRKVGAEHAVHRRDARAARAHRERHDLAAQLLTSQRTFAEDVLKATAPLTAGQNDAPTAKNDAAAK